MFLGVILDVIILFLCFLGCNLIYSLMMMSVDARVFDLAVMRMVGMSKLRIIVMLLGLLLLLMMMMMLLLLLLFFFLLLL